MGECHDGTKKGVHREGRNAFCVEGAWGAGKKWRKNRVKRAVMKRTEFERPNVWKVENGKKLCGR